MSPPSAESGRLYISGNARENAKSLAREYFLVRELQESSSESRSQRFRWIMRSF